MTPSDFLKLIEDHLTASGETATAFGKRVMNDPNFVFKLRDDREPRYATQQKVLAALAPAKRKRAA